MNEIDRKETINKLTMVVGYRWHGMALDNLLGMYSALIDFCPAKKSAIIYRIQEYTGLTSRNIVDRLGLLIFEEIVIDSPSGLLFINEKYIVRKKTTNRRQQSKNGGAHARTQRAEADSAQTRTQAESNARNNIIINNKKDSNNSFKTPPQEEEEYVKAGRMRK